MRFGRNFRQRQPGAPLTLVQRYRNTLKKYGTLSHLWDFGVAAGPLAFAASHTAAEFIAAYPLWHLWQDTAGTVPACKINDPVGLCKDQYGGAHASQTTTTKRPILSGRVNLLTSSENLSAWTLINSSGNATKVGNTLTFGASPSDRCLITGSTIVAATSYMRRVTLYGSGSVRLFSLDGSGATQVQRDVTLTSTPTTYALSGVLTSSGSGGGVAIYNNAAGTAGAVVNFINADLRPANSPTNIPAYQRVTSATDYDTVGFPVRALFDGVDDCLVVPSLDLSMTDKVTVVAGVTKLSDANGGMVCELTNDTNLYNGALFLLSPRSASYSEPAFTSKGTSAALAAQSINSLQAPRGMVLSATASISTDSAILSVNDSVYGTSASDQGTGNFSAGPFNIGARNGGASAPFNGAIQSLAVIGNLLPDGEVQILEASANAAMGKVY